jgi:hypothetical protein
MSEDQTVVPPTGRFCNDYLLDFWQWIYFSVDGKNFLRSFSVMQPARLVLSKGRGGSEKAIIVACQN